MSYRNNSSKTSRAINYTTFGGYNSPHGSKGSSMMALNAGSAHQSQMVVPVAQAHSYNTLQHNVEPSGKGYFSLNHAYAHEPTFPVTYSSCTAGSGNAAGVNQMPVAMGAIRAPILPSASAQGVTDSAPSRGAGNMMQGNMMQGGNMMKGNLIREGLKFEPNMQRRADLHRYATARIK